MGTNDMKGKESVVLSEEELQVKKQIEEDIESMIRNKNIGVEDKNTYRMILALLTYGADKEKVKRIANFRGFEKHWTNLKAGGYFSEDGKIVLEGGSDEILFLSILLMGAVARGFIVREREAHE
jgi:ribosomal protein L6P/L9E